MMLQSYIDAWVEELERVVCAFEAAVDEVEQAMDKAEQASVSDEPVRELRRDQDLRQLENALESAQQVAALVKAVNAALADAIEAAQLVVANEQVGLPVDNCEASTPIDQAQSLSSLVGVFTGFGAPTGFGEPAKFGAPARAPARDAPTIHGMLDAVGVPNLDSGMEPLPGGSIIMQGKYRIVRLLHRRLRLNLYLAERLNDQSRSFVTIRELVLTGLSPDMSKQVERAAFEEFATPMLFGSPHLPGAGDRVCIENERHYTVMQLRPVRGRQPAIAVSLADLLLHQPRWPAWLDIETAWEWGIQLCRIVARLHRMGVALGDLHPATILVDPQSAAAWAPVLLVSWPPPSRFWSNSSSYSQSVQELSTQVFPIAEVSAGNAFTAPEIFKGEYDERSDVYSLGAILYLLLTRYASVTAIQRMSAEQTSISSEMQEQSGTASSRFGSGSMHSYGGMALIPPHLFNSHISPALEQVVVRALSLNADDRYSSVAALVEALRYA